MDRVNDRQRTTLICAVLCALTLASLWPVVHNSFINFDDPDYITENPHVLSGITWHNLAWAFQTGYAGNWHPLTWISHMLDVQVYGLNPAGHHVTSLILHALNGILVFLVLRRMTGATWRSACVAGLFALHPLHVESVAWVSERKDVLSAFFFILTLWGYTRYVRVRQQSKTGPAGFGAPGSLDPAGRTRTSASIFYALTLLCFALGLMSKPMLVTLPFLLLLLDYWPLRRFEAAAADGNSPARTPLAECLGLIREKIPFLLLALAASFVTFWVQKKQGAVAPGGLPWDSRAANAVLSYARYLGKTVWPQKLGIFYPHPATLNPELSAWITWEFGLALVLLVSFSVVAIRNRRQRPYLAVGWCWYLGTLIPVIGLIQVGAQAMADRYTYLPLIGVFVAGSWALADLPPAPWRAWGCGLVALLLVACSVLTHSQAARWKNSLTIFAHTLEVTHDNATAHFNYGAALEQNGDLKAAMVHYREALRLEPSAESYYNLGHGLTSEGKLAEAVEAYQAALRLKPAHDMAHNNLATVFHALGQYDKAALEYQEALRLQPGFVQAHYNLGKLHADSGDFAGAEKEYRATLQLQPNHGAAQVGLGLVLAAQERFSEAIPFLERTVLILSNSPSAYLALGNALTDAGQPAAANVHFKTALRLDPDLLATTLQTAASLAQQGQLFPAIARYVQAVRLAPGIPEIHERLGMLMTQVGLTNEALTNFYQVVNLQPSPQAHYNLALALVLSGQSRLAIPEYQEALRLKPDWAAALNDLAWILATDPDGSIRNGAQAIALAEAACRLEAQQARYWGTLDAAYAEAGRFDTAITTAERTRDLASSQGLKDIAEAAQERLNLYRAGHPFRQKTVSQPTGPNPK